MLAILGEIEYLRCYKNSPEYASRLKDKSAEFRKKTLEIQDLQSVVMEQFEQFNHVMSVWDPIPFTEEEDENEDK